MHVCFGPQVISKETIRIGSNYRNVRCNGVNGSDLPFCRKFDQRKFSAIFLIRPDTSMIRSKADVLIPLLYCIEGLVHAAKLPFCLRKIGIRFFLTGADHAEAVIRQQPVIACFILMYFEYMQRGKQFRLTGINIPCQTIILIRMS